MTLIKSKYLTVDWSHRPDGRRFRFKRNLFAHSLYLQVGHLEVVVWYR